MKMFIRVYYSAAAVLTDRNLTMSSHVLLFLPSFIRVCHCYTPQVQRIVVIPPHH